MKDYSNYHGSSFSEKIIHDGNLIFERGLKGFEGIDVKINGANTRVLLLKSFSNKEGTTKYVLGNIGEIERGKIVKVNTENWLIISKPEDNKIYRKAMVKLCNTSLLLPGELKRTQVGTDEFGRPEYEEVKGDPIEVPCIVESTIPSSQDDKPINLPLNRVKITLSYRNDKALNKGANLKLYGEEYQIKAVDKTQAINGVGLLILIAETDGDSE